MYIYIYIDDTLTSAGNKRSAPVASISKYLVVGFDKADGSLAPTDPLGSGFVALKAYA